MSRNFIRTCATLCLAVLLLGIPLCADEAQLAGWQTDADRAWQTAQTDQRLLLVYVSMANCGSCRRMERETLVDAKVAEDILAKYVPVTVTAETNQALVKKLRVNTYPTTVIISPQAGVVDHITGYVPPRELARHLEAAVRTTDGRRR